MLNIPSSPEYQHRKARAAIDRLVQDLLLAYAGTEKAGRTLRDVVDWLYPLAPAEADTLLKQLSLAICAAAREWGDDE